MSDLTSNFPLVQLSLDSTEHWKDIPGYEGLYAVSDHGHIAALFDTIYGGHKAGRTIKPCPTPTGYRKITLHKNGKAKTPSVHSLVMLAFVGTRPIGIQINHKNGDKADNRLSNLEYATASENNFHRHRVLHVRQRDNRGEQNPHSRLKEFQVREIKILLRSGEMTQKEIADRFGIAFSTLNAIKRRKAWRHID